jgi:hypothetical protein
MVKASDGVDPIWQHPARVQRLDADTWRVVSDRTGRFAYPAGFEEYIRHWDGIDKAKITTWVLDSNRAGESPVITRDAMAQIETRQPLGMTQKIDRFLQMLEADRFRPGDPLPWRDGLETSETVRVRNRTMMWVEASSEREFYSFKQILLEARILAMDENNRLVLGVAAYDRMDSSRKAGAETDQAFVAMWFHKSLHGAFDNGIEPAIRRAGYRAIRIDRKEHNNKIDDEIIGEIRKSRFVVADFTCGTVQSDGALYAISRGGVYYEAGFAQGLGTPVIWTVRSDQIDSVHFDTRQYNHIAWTTPEELQQKLFHRVIAVLGRGPLN